MPKIVRINEDDLREIFFNRPQHLSHPDRLQPYKLTILFQKQSKNNKLWPYYRIDDARRIWGKVSFEVIDEIRRYTKQKPKQHNKRRELVKKLSSLYPNENAERLMRWTISCCVFSNEQLQFIQDHRPEKIEYSKRELAIKQGMQTKDEIEARMQYIQDLWSNSRDTGIEDPEVYLNTNVVESAIEQVEKMCREGATVPEMAREAGATNKAVADYFKKLKPLTRKYLLKNRAHL